MRVKIRSTTEPAAAMLHQLPDNGAKVVFATPEAGVAPGQACVFYDGERVLGGGWIQRQDARLAA